MAALAPWDADQQWPDSVRPRAAGDHVRVLGRRLFHRDDDHRDVDRQARDEDAHHPRAVGPLLPRRDDVQPRLDGHSAGRPRDRVSDRPGAAHRLHLHFVDAPDRRAHDHDRGDRAQEPMRLVLDALRRVRVHHQLLGRSVAPEDVQHLHFGWRCRLAPVRHLHDHRGLRHLEACQGRERQALCGRRRPAHALHPPHPLVHELGLDERQQHGWLCAHVHAVPVRVPRIRGEQARRPARPARRRAREGAAREGHPAVRPSC
mmetsp:Transcript_23490/g.60413  ORF Transcript_23490/g.60413 Transcript_23490/m.60413 type:complete len:260 (+) Transcript_23490:351-1130(+)